MIGYAVSFMAGAMFGTMTMCLLVANGRLEEQEVRKFAGGSGKQDREPCDQHDEAVDADDHSCGDDVPAAPEAGKGPEKE